MSSVIIAGNTSGTVSLSAPDVAGTTVLTLPATSGTVLTTTGGVAPGTSGNVLTSNGTTWTSSALPAGGVTSLNGQTGAITNTSLYAIGSYVTGRPQNTTNYTVDSTVAGSSLYSLPPGSWYSGSSFFTLGNNNPPLGVLVNTGTWRCVSPASFSTNAIAGLWVRIS